MERVKIATHQCLFGQEKWVLKSLENCYPFVDKIYLSYSELPWGYNTSARTQYKNNLNLDIIKNSRFMDKIEFIYGDWITDEAQRNACADKAAADGYDILMIQDSDEFYSNRDFQNIIDYLTECPNYDVYTCAWLCFWKTPEYCIVNNQGSDIVGNPQIAINLKRGVRFRRMRTPDSTNYVHIDNALCYHMSYVLTNDECLQKIKTWGHSYQFDTDKWYRDVWLAWTPDKINLHPIAPSDWYKAVPCERELPEVLR